MSEIKKVKIGPVCMESYPCQHYVEIEYEDGSKKSETYDGVEIYENFSKYFSESEKRHFLEYKNFDYKNI